MATTAVRPSPAIDSDLCQLCSRCRVVTSCKWQAVIRFDREETPVIDMARCQRCLICVARCDHEAVVLV